MNQIQPKADVLAVSLSVLCILHCLLVPILVIALPSVTALFFTDEAFHIWMVIAVIPISLVALFNGFKRHGGAKFLSIGIIGLVLLVGAAFLGHDLLSETGERLITVIGAVLMTITHIYNYYSWKTGKRVNSTDTHRF